MMEIQPQKVEAPEMQEVPENAAASELNKTFFESGKNEAIDIEQVKRELERNPDFGRASQLEASPTPEATRQPDVNQPGAISELTLPAGRADSGGENQLPDLSQASMPTEGFDREQLREEIEAAPSEPRLQVVNDLPPAGAGSGGEPPSDRPPPDLSQLRMPADFDIDQAQKEIQPPRLVDKSEPKEPQ
jgi:hypothetical protein